MRRHIKRETEQILPSQLEGMDKIDIFDHTEM